MTDNTGGPSGDASWARARALFGEAIELEEEARTAFLNQACAGDAQLRVRVERLLAADSEDNGPLDRPIQDVADAIEPTPEVTGTGQQARPDDRVGSYRLVEALGHGGMGEVWRAVQEEPVRRDVAVKLVRGALDAVEVLARFEVERQALALMDHPSIAKVFDAGSTEEGRPYFVMELIRGVPINEYADIHRLDTRQRVSLLATVCHAVQHAHQKGVIHRDLKPSNVLVTVAADRPYPKIIDFGVAKATGGRLTGRTLHTRVGEIVGTPQYMSPEQAEMTSLDIDTRTDVYSLGVILYELLVGALPFDRALFSKPDFLIAYLLRETDAPRPSRRLETLADTQQTVARNRSTQVAELRRQLRGDLDWIVMRAMDKDRSRRYASASELAADLERYVAGQPVLARPPSPGYRLSRFVRRNRAAAVAASVAALAVVVGLVGTSVGFFQARSAQLAATREAEVAAEISNFLIGLFEVSDPREEGGDSVSARQLLDRGSARVREELTAQPELQARFGAVIADVYAAMGAPVQTAEMRAFTTAVLTNQLKASHPEVTAALMKLSNAYSDLGPDSAYQRRVREVSDRIDSILDAGQIEVPVVRAAAELRRAAHTWQDPDAAEAGMARALEMLLPFAADTMTRAELGELSPRDWYKRALNNNAIFASRVGDVERAGELFGRLVEEEVADAGWEGSSIASWINNLAVVLSRTGQADSAAVLWERAIELQERSNGPDHLSLARPLTNLGSVLLARGDTSGAIARWVRADAIWNEAFGENHPYGPKTSLALVFLAQGRVDEAERYATQRWKYFLDASRTDPWSSAAARRALARVFVARGRADEAEEHLRFVVDGLMPDWLDGLGADGRPDPDYWYANELALISRDLPGAMDELADLLENQGRSDEAGELAARALEIRAAATSG